MSELAYLSAIEIAEKIRQREISSREAVDYFLARVEKLDKSINAVVTIDAERARKEADAADAALARGTGRGPLHGVPMTVKESYDVAGYKTTWGVPEMKDNVAREDALSIRRLKGAGEKQQHQRNEENTGAGETNDRDAESSAEKKQQVMRPRKAGQ